MTERAVVVPNTPGMHARAAARFVRAATRFEARVEVSRDERTVEGKSIMGLLLLAGARGVILTVKADGRDEEEAVETLCRLVESGFGEDRA